MVRDILFMSHGTAANRTPYATDRGRLVGVKDFLFGQSADHRAEDEAIRRRHATEIERMRQNALDQAREQRKQMLDRAANDLKEAKAEEAKLVQALDDARKELSDSSNQLAEVTANLEKAKDEFERLTKKDLELVGRRFNRLRGIANHTFLLERYLGYPGQLDKGAGESQGQD